MNKGGSYCLRDPVTASGYPTLSSMCTANSNITWTWNQTAYKRADGTLGALPYAQQYTITDSNGQCLAASAASDLFNNQFPKLIVTACDGDVDQKWNVDPHMLIAASITTKEN
jgi:hypothetical protein